MAKIFGSEFHIDLTDLLKTISTYPYNLAVGVAAAGTILFLVRRHFAGGVCRSKAKLKGKTVIITGANTGIGKETAIDLAKRKARVILACRSDERGEQAAAEIRRMTKNDDVVYRHLDLASLASVRQFCEAVLQDEAHIDILINNAGIMRCPYWKTEDGFEMQIGVNHFGHFLLTNLLLPRMKEAPSARVVNVSSIGYKRCEGIQFDDINSENGYDPFTAYAHSKLANILFTRSLAQRLEGSNVTTNCLHPGVIWTDLGRHMIKSYSAFKKIMSVPIVLLFLKTPRQGAQTTIHCAVSEHVANVSGQYFADCKQKALVTRAAKDDDAAERLWALSATSVGLEEKEQEEN